ncbi:torsin-1A-interacting protein 2-like isoform X2 [Betta splendens]|uniref:Torsin-1A-interacting protein 2-like isoform X2 n=1 Tax=Betta splendens TaxID=158456 RepID=A0A6P7MBJ0_BETSP|nr:torsin-1A-interacting protein 2-like isoform X2 [Betta splendens]
MAEQVTELTQQQDPDKTQSTSVACSSTHEEFDQTAASQDTEDENNSGKSNEATLDTNDHPKCEFQFHEGMAMPKNAPTLQTVDKEGKTLDELRNNDITTSNASEETDPDLAPPTNMMCDENTQAEENHTGEIKAEEPTTDDDHVDGPKHEDTNTEAAGDSVLLSAPKSSESESDSSDNMDQAGDKRIEREEQVKPVETIGATCQEATEPTFPEDSGMFAGRQRYLHLIALTIVVMLAAILVQYVRQPKSPPQINDVRHIDIFLRQLEKVKTQFPNQRSELWNRCRIHLKRHLLTAHPTEPVSLILTAGSKAERTLGCLAQSLASAFSAALNASVLHIDGASRASQDSDSVKLDIDKLLQGAFGGDKPVAVIHRFEELPPGSTLIFYRYCDHENAAFKKTFLIFTVLLGEEESLPAQIRLSDVEEMVDDHLQKKFLSHGHPVSFDRMDLDKYGGLWSRISHLILPVASEDRVERDGCKDT